VVLALHAHIPYFRLRFLAKGRALSKFDRLRLHVFALKGSIYEQRSDGVDTDSS
jgi:hypothetical protein